MVEMIKNIHVFLIRCNGVVVLLSLKQVLIACTGFVTVLRLSSTDY